MINFTLTITAAPELLAAISGFTSSITAAKVVTIPQTDLNFPPIRSANEQQAGTVSLNSPTVQTNTYQSQNSGVQQITPTQPIQNNIPTNVIPVNSQPAANIVQAPRQSQATQSPIVPTSSQTYTMEQLAVAATQIVDAGRRTELVNLLSSFGVQALTALPKEQYGAFATQLRTLGAKIDNLCVQQRNTGGSKI